MEHGGKLIQEVFKSYQKDEELYQLHLETYRKIMLHLIMLPFNFEETQTQTGSTSEFSVHRSEEPSKGNHMGVDLLVTPKLPPIELEMTSNTTCISSTA
jgi:hypothetical protein